MVQIHVMNRRFKVQIHVLPPGAGAEADPAGTRSVSAMGHGTKQSYIAVDDVDWLIAYVAKEAALGTGDSGAFIRSGG